MAADRGISLNELCLRAVESYTAVPHAWENENKEEERVWLKTLQKLLGDSLVGVILFGSTPRGEARSNSDIDLLIVVDSALPLNRRLYGLWDEHFPEGPCSPHFVHLPASTSEAGSIWFEAAIDGIVLTEKDRLLSRILGRFRRAIAPGRLVRKTAYGHSYWIKKQEDSSNVQ